MELKGKFLITFSYFCLFTLLSTINAQDLMLTDRMIEFVRSYYGETSVERLLEWQKLIQTNLNKTEMQKLETVNQFFNRIPSKADIDHWGKRNYWATPFELMATGGGDCEDFAIAKYFTLKALNVDDSKLRITYVTAYQQKKTKISIVPHMVLAYYSDTGREPLILDNLFKAILPASGRSDLKPKYSFNGEGLWRAKRRGRGKLIGRAEYLSPWQDLLDRMSEEGYE